ncbi:hypothetical protein SAMN02910317_01354 [Ruminococcaceae bacterium FB2012]|nr:hypothetical protein SAMN02910317_01354 [Ruminococcaceae bacterium FB2012]
MNKEKKQRASLFHSSNAVNIITIIVVTLVCIVLVLVLAKGLFASNSKDVPAGLNTATIANSAAGASQSASATTTSAAPVSGTTAAGGSVSEVTTEARDDSVAYVVTYVQLKAQPNQDSANVICMSPNIKVKILERREDGYIHLTFLNGDGTECSGYVKTEYLSPTPVERTTPAETTAASEQEVPASETTAVTGVSETTASSRSNNALIETVAQ